ncbi:hypothetical protein [Pseudoclavibacter soli]|uniref:hypothetical protein n=1 Tax=Pseudoclavibacter soli TaxID=452623 RepID=UPI0004017294
MGKHAAPDAGSGLTLTPEFVEALELLDSGSNMFLTGKAGTGKSTLIRLDLEHTDRRAITVAPTGIAALRRAGGCAQTRLGDHPTASSTRC